MKRILLVLLAVVWTLAFAACNGKPFAFPDSAQEEYERVYSLNDGKPFDFEKLAVFSARQTLTLYIPELTELKDTSGGAAYPTTESRTYMWDARNRNNIKSQITDTVVSYNTLNADKYTIPQYLTPTRKVFVTDSLSSPVMDVNGKQTDEAVLPQKFDSYEDYMMSSYSYDYDMQRIAPYPWEWFESVKGEELEKGIVYGITATVKQESYLDFFDKFAAEYSFRRWYTQAEGGDRDSRVYENFLDPRFLSSVTVEIITEKTALRSVEIEFRAHSASPVPLEGIGAVTLKAKTTYSTASSSISSITAPRYLGQ